VATLACGLRSRAGAMGPSHRAISSEHPEKRGKEVRPTNGSGGMAAHASIDLTGIDPVHWAEARRRVAILREWCATARHSKAEGEVYARRMGVSVKHFARLVAVWRKHGDVVRIAGAGSPRGTPRKAVRLPAATHRAIAETIAELGSSADFELVRREAERRCEAAGTRTASTGMVHHLLMRARQQGEAADSATKPVILIGRVRLLLPVDVGSGVAEPDLLLAMVKCGGQILGHRLILNDNLAASASELLAELSTEGGAMEGATTILSSDVARALGGAPRPAAKHGKRSRLLSKELGSSLAGLPVRHQGKRCESHGIASALNPEDAAEAVEAAVAKHNASRRPGPAAGDASA
jgi:hypothetical protein